MNAQTLDTLKAENFSDESYLKPENKRILNKMFKYIRTFPLNEYDTEMIRKDLIGMAKEAEMRNESFYTVIGEKPNDFCNKLILAISGITVPKGRPYLRSATVFYRFCGCYFIMQGCAGILLILKRIISGEEMIVGLINLIDYLSNFPIPREISIIFYLIIGYLFTKAGNIASIYNSDVKHADICLKWGRIVLAVSAITLLLGLFILTNLLPNLFICIGLIYSFVYIKGARLNKEI